MGKISAVYLMPHPPIIIPEVGRGEERKIQNTSDALDKCGRHILGLKPDTIIVITPHGPVFRDAIAIASKNKLTGNLARFGAGKVAMSFENDLDLVQSIMDEAEKSGIACIGIDNKVAVEYGISISLDWGVLVPLYFVTKQYRDFRLIHISISFLSYEELYVFGTAVRNAVESSDRHVCIIASGDLSHRLSQDGPYGFHPMGPKLDQQIIDHAKAGNAEGFLTMDPVMVKEGGECGLRSIIISMGALDGYNIRSRVLSYEGPFGVGYGVAMFERRDKNKKRELVNRIYARKQEHMAKVRKSEDPYVSLARRSLESYIRTGEIIKPGSELPKEMLEEKAGVFVSIKKNGQLRGCIGTIQPQRDNIAEEIIHNAISAGVRDPRFMPVDGSELGDLVYSVDVLEKPESVDTDDELDPKKYGVIVRSGLRSGLLLPNLEGIDTVREQIEIALQKAGIRPDEHYTLERFEVKRHS
ncbi:MAG: AmmeMemoRadiSam system protein A [Clostridiales bacterium]|jgi:AmmeMemoRadiSam system protein A|nr:AmmeMemoRadiSam system protein A [Clostridiales bacterium]